MRKIKVFAAALPLIGALALGGAPAMADDVKLRLWSGGFAKEGQRAIRDVIGEFEDLGAPATPHVDAEAREQLAGLEHGILCLLPPVGKEEFWSRTLAQEVFPPKTTFFEPKISTGMVVRYTDEEDV